MKPTEVPTTLLAGTLATGEHPDSKEIERCHTAQTRGAGTLRMKGLMNVIAIANGTKAVNTRSDPNDWRTDHPFILIHGWRRSNDSLGDGFLTSPYQSLVSALHNFFASDKSKLSLALQDLNKQ